jgi:hypothetical protein
MDRLGASGMFWTACGFAVGSLALIGAGAGRESGFPTGAGAPRSPD